MLKENIFAPDFRLPDQNGDYHSLSSYKGNWLLIYFYPMDFTPGCTKEACSIRDSFADFSKYHIKVLGISGDSMSSHKKFAEKHNLSFPLLADSSKDVIRRYEANFLFFTKRISYLIDPKGKIRKAYNFVNPSKHPHQVILDVQKEINCES